MFESIKNYFRDIRINLDFPQYERKCRDEHEEQAKRRFSTKQLDDERNKLLENIKSKARAKYDALTNEKEEERGRHEISARDTESILSYFTRHYKQELDDCYQEKDELLSKKSNRYEEINKIRNLLSEAFEEKDKAYSELNYYKAKIDSWYAKSDRTPWLFGNCQKEVTETLTIRAEFGDLDSYKYHRDSTYDEVKEAKRRIVSLKQDQQALNIDIGQIKKEIGEIYNQINKIKKDRSTMYELKKAGYNKRDLQSKLNNLFFEINKLSSEISSIEENRKEYISLEKHRYGAIDLESKIREIEQKKIRFLVSFNLDKNIQERKRQHREAWLKQRGMA